MATPPNLENLKTLVSSKGGQKKRRRFPGMLHTRDVQGYPLHGLDVVHEWPKPKYPLHDLVKLWQEAKQREEEANRRVEHWHRTYNSLKQDYLALKDRDLCLSCQRFKDESKEGETVELCHECSNGHETRKAESGTEAKQGLPRPQILARLLQNPIERDRKKQKQTPVGIVFLFITRNLSYPRPPPFFLREGRKIKKLTRCKLSPFFCPWISRPTSLIGLNAPSKDWIVIGIDDGTDLSLALTLNDLLHDIIIHVL